MTTTSTLSRRRRGIRGTAAAFGSAALLMMTALPASANTIDVEFDANGSTYVASTGSTIALGPTVMSSHVAGDGTFTGHMELPGTRTHFQAAGFIPVTADVNFEPVGPTTGALVRTPDRRQELHSTTQFYLRLSNINVGGFPAFTGSNCRTIEPVTINANTPAGQTFDVANGGIIAGEFSIGNFQNCGLFNVQTHLINALIPGGGNTVELNLTDGRLS